MALRIVLLLLLLALAAYLVFGSRINFRHPFFKGLLALLGGLAFRFFLLRRLLPQVLKFLAALRFFR